MINVKIIGPSNYVDYTNVDDLDYDDNEISFTVKKTGVKNKEVTVFGNFCAIIEEVGNEE